MSNPDISELLANVEQLAELTERVKRSARTLAHDHLDGRRTPAASIDAYLPTIERAAEQVERVRALVATVKSQIKVH